MAERAYAVAATPEGPDTEPASARRIHLVTKRASLPSAVQHLSAREISALVFLSALLHAGLAYGFYTQDKTPVVPHVSKVDIEFARPPEPPKREQTPPPPPPPPPTEKAPPPPAKPEAAPAPAAEAPATESPAAPAEEAPAEDSGSSAEAADDGNLRAGKGGLGVTPPPPPPAPKVVAPPAPAPIVAAHEGANYSKNPRPGYPKRALREGWQGEVLVRVRVLPNGRAGQLKVQKSSGHELLDEAALAAIQSWSFVPARQGGQPVAGWVTVPIVFRLQ